MAHTYALSISQDNITGEKWVRECVNSTINDYEYSCGRFPDHQEILSKIAILKPHLDAGEFRCTSLHLPFYWAAERPTQPYDFERETCARRLAHTIDSFAPLGMKHLTMHLGSAAPGQSRENAIECVRKVVRFLLPHVEKCGASLNLEMCPRGSIGGVPEEMEQILDGMPECVGICFDVNHASPRSAEVPQWIARLAKRIRSFHISDCDNIDECHWFPGYGVLDWEGIMREIDRIDHDCLLIYEVSRDGFSAPAFENREADPIWFIRHLEKNMEYLKSL